MNKEQILGVLECCLLCSEDISFDKLVSDYKFNPLIAETGIKLYLFLQKKEINKGIFEK